MGCFAIWPVNNRCGRRVAIGVCSAVFCAGVVLEVIDLHSLTVFYLGRVLCGLGVGGSSSVIPVYLSEMAPKEVRGSLGSCYQFMFTIGILVSYWTDYYAVRVIPPGSAAQWQVPIALQLVPALLMGLGVLTLDESVRWLVSQGRHDQARRSLEWIRASDDRLVVDELAEIRAGIEDERRARAGLSLRELLFEPSNAHRISLAVGIFLAQQSTGATALAYFGPQFFSMVVPSQNLSLLLTGIFGVIKVLSCGTFILFISDRFGRKTLLLAGAGVMAICMMMTAEMVKTTTTTDETEPHQAAELPPKSLFTIVLIYLTITAYNLSWGPLPWPYTSEIFPTRIREAGVAFGVGAQWLFNLLWSSGTPYLLAGLGGGGGGGGGGGSGWMTFLLFSLLDILIMLFVSCCLKETNRRTLEEISAMF